MIHTDSIKEPILVLNPLTEKYVNVTPLFNTVGINFDHSFNRAGKSIDNAIEAIATANMPDFDQMEMANIMHTLFNLRNVMFETTEFKQDGGLSS